MAGQTDADKNRSRLRKVIGCQTFVDPARDMGFKPAATIAVIILVGEIFVIAIATPGAVAARERSAWR